MLKKILISFLLVAFINLLTGCYSFQSVSLSEFTQYKIEKGKPNEIYVKTKEHEWYHFTNSNYYIKNDTLFGNGKLLEEGWGELSSNKIALINIESLGINKKDWARTYLAYAGIGLAVIGIILFSWIFFSPKHKLG